MTRANNHDLIVWQELPDGSQRGMLSEHVSQPYLAEVDARGRWALYAYDQHDQRQNVASGKANKVNRAKQHTLAAALAHIPELQDDTHNHDPSGAQTRDIRQRNGAVIDAKVTRLERTQPPGWLVTLKVYLALSMFCLAAALFARWLLIYRPVIALRVFGWVGGSVFAAHKIIKWLEDANKRRERLERRQVLEARGKR